MSVENYITKKEKIEKCHIEIENLEKEEKDSLRAFYLIKNSLFYMRLFYGTIALQGLLTICVLINLSLITPLFFFLSLMIICLSGAALIDALSQFEKAKGCDYEVKNVIKNIFILKSKSINNYYEKILKTKTKIKSAENEIKTLNNNLMEIKNHLSSSSFEDYLESTFFDKDKFKMIEELINEKVAEKEDDIYARKKLINHSISKLKDLEETYETIKNY
jgi:hypothetical protein